MATIEYYHRYNKDGSCETVCTRCFLTVGRANDPAQLKLMEATHSCPTQPSGLKGWGAGDDRRNGAPSEIPKQASPSPAPRVDRLWRFLGGTNAANTFLLLFSIALCFYLLPTVMEFEMMKHMGVWIACVLLGDLAGCSFLSLGLGLRKTGVALYAVLTGGEAWLYAVHIVPPHLLVWLTDLGPTLAITSLVAFCSFNTQRLNKEAMGLR